MRAVLAGLFALLFAVPALAAGQITCSQIPAAQRFVAGLKPGPNTREAQRHLDAARKAKSDKECVTELGRVNYYAKRAAAADKRLENTARSGKAKAAKSKPTAHQPSAAGAAPRKTAATPKSAAVPPSTAAVPRPKPALPVKCADPLHQDRPGGSDYKGPPVPGCRPVL
jgi:hypothetical protein